MCHLGTTSRNIVDVKIIQFTVVRAR